MDIETLYDRAREFNKKLDETKKSLDPQDFPWYPYGTLANFAHLETLLSGTEYTEILELARGQPIADIGAADGDTAFFLESLGHQVDAIDYPPTNCNSCRGIRALKPALDSSIGLHEVDLDAHFELPGQHYGLAFFLGILYHLKNPYGAMESLSRLADYALVSTRIARYNTARENVGNNGINRQRQQIEDIPAAYLVAPMETNNDATNFWMFTDAGLKRLLDRCGWDILAYTSLGDVRNSDPAHPEHDERAFCLLRSRHAAPAG